MLKISSFARISQINSPQTLIYQYLASGNKQPLDELSNFSADEICSTISSMLMSYPNFRAKLEELAVASGCNDLGATQQQEVEPVV